MKKIVLFLIAMAILGFLSYFGAYYAYKASNPGIEITDPVYVERSEIKTKVNEEPYFLIKLEDDLLKIYQMPEETVYDTVTFSSLQVYDQTEQLKDGLRFQTLTEVFEFLENSMS